MRLAIIHSSSQVTRRRQAMLSIHRRSLPHTSKATRYSTVLSLTQEGRAQFTHPTLVVPIFRRRSSITCTIQDSTFNLHRRNTVLSHQLIVRGTSSKARIHPR